MLTIEEMKRQNEDYLLPVGDNFDIDNTIYGCYCYVEPDCYEACHQECDCFVEDDKNSYSLTSHNDGEAHSD